MPFFANASEAFITSIITRVTFDVFLPGDYVTQCGAIGTKMFFIQHGILDVVNRDGKVATSLCDGSYFGGNAVYVYYIYVHHQCFDEYFDLFRDLSLVQVSKSSQC